MTNKDDLSVGDVVVYTSEFDSIYGQEAKCFRIGLFDSQGNQIGKFINYESHMSAKGMYGKSQTFSKFGLHLRILKVKNFVPRKRTEADKPSRELVTVQRFNREGTELVSMVKEYRAVYTNSKGRYIKTRSEGVCHLTIDKPATVQFHGRKVVKHG